MCWALSDAFLGSKGPPHFLVHGTRKKWEWRITIQCQQECGEDPRRKAEIVAFYLRECISSNLAACILAASTVNFLCYEDWEEFSPSSHTRQQMLTRSLPDHSITLSGNSRICCCQGTYLQLKESLMLHTDFKLCCTTACLFTLALIKSTCYFHIFHVKICKNKGCKWRSCKYILSQIKSSKNYISFEIKSMTIQILWPQHIVSR